MQLFYGPIEPTWIVDPGQLNRENPSLPHAGDEALAPTHIGNRGTRRGKDRCMRTVHFMVPLCCDKCEKDLTKNLLECDGESTKFLCHG